MAEPIKTKFEKNDFLDPELICPCDHCEALDWWPPCDDGATSSACNHCSFAIMSYLLTHNIN